MINSKKAIIFLAFANDRVDSLRYLRNLPEEARRIREALRSSQSLFKLEVRQNATLEEILDVFQENRHRVAVFHYGGHANGFKLLLETAQGSPRLVDAGGLAEFLGQQHGLQLVFLNGCSTERQVDGLLQAGVSTVVATTQSIDDAVATELASRFYRGLASGASIGAAYAESVSAIKIDKGAELRDLLCFDETAAGLATADRWPWILRHREGAEASRDWNLPDSADQPLFGLPRLPLLDLPERPYRYLHHFTQDDAQVFFGRGYQIRELYQKVIDPQGSPIILLYGQSGVGKSSLLDAGR